MQNLASEIEAAQSDTRRVGNADESLEEPKATVDRYSELFLLLIEDYNGRFPHELFIWESLFQIQQDLLLVWPSEHLLAEWDVGRTRPGSKGENRHFTLPLHVIFFRMDTTNVLPGNLPAVL